MDLQPAEAAAIGGMDMKNSIQQKASVLPEEALNAVSGGFRSLIEDESVSVIAQCASNELYPITPSSPMADNIE